ncbi:cache domain-containing sensor histidine kinase [Paenibacillus sp. FA6]|uniref:cache domain-containing sensor histidine kinase n=1 Tax=Paenibacillus sp. FA6 TaxID=3413029 RepID=UPI003F6580D5
MRKYKSAFNNMGIHYKMIGLISLLMLVSFAVYITVLKSVFSIYDEQIYEKSSQVLTMSSVGIESQLKEMEELSFKVVSDEQIQSYLTKLKSNSSAYEKLVLHKKITDRIIAFAGSEKYVYSMMVIDKERNVMVAGNREGIPESLQNELVSLAEEYDGSNAWMMGGRGFSLLGVREIKSFTNATFTLENLGTLVFRVRIDRIVDDQVQDAGNEGQLIITDGKDILYPEEPLLTESEIMVEMNNDKPYSIESYEHGRYFTAKFRSSYTDWTYFHITPFHRMFERITFIKNFVTVIFILIFVVAILFGTKLALSITRPIDRLIKKMRDIEKGDLDSLEELALGAVPSSPQSEVGLLHRTFKMMIQRIRELINENYTKQLLIRETELKALQAQINPHFLYNTLESINWLAKVNKQDQISKMVESLGFLLRNSINFSEQLIPLRSELDIVMSYVTIQKVRFEERLDFIVEIESHLENALIPKLTLQPLVENAIHYALEPNIEPCRIRIMVIEKNGVVTISVQDNGPGMDSKFIKKLLEGKVQTSGKGIGLSNIEERIKLTFGNEWGIDIQSEPNIQTSVQITIPYVRGDDLDV